MAAAGRASISVAGAKPPYVGFCISGDVFSYFLISPPLKISLGGGLFLNAANQIISTRQKSLQHGEVLEETAADNALI